MCSVDVIARHNQGPVALPRYIPVNKPALTPVKQSRKTLRFRPMVSVRVIDCSKTDEEKSRSHYSKSEMNAMSLEAKRMCTSCKCGAHATLQECVHGLNADPAIRGLERYMCPTRVQNKALAKKALLKYHKQLKANPNRTSEDKIQSLALASAKLSVWSRKVALETARLDSLRASEGEDSMISEVGTADILPLDSNMKRQRDTSDECCQPAKRRQSQ
mmetsp:Transcript_41109/g.86365  ORF Transcript_41109/g.86365 Transcript_41109/m.86365 type:complete len:217 (-) Transcript_41109:54-704(-)